MDAVEAITIERTDSYLDGACSLCHRHWTREGIARHDVINLITSTGMHANRFRFCTECSQDVADRLREVADEIAPPSEP